MTTFTSLSIPFSPPANFFRLAPEFLIDFYKTGHIRQYPVGTSMVYFNHTARSGKYAKWLTDFDNKIVNVGQQAAIQYLFKELWYDEFFWKPKNTVLGRWTRLMDNCLGPGAVPADAIGKLHDIGYLPLVIKTLPEGVRVPIGVPTMTIRNDHEKHPDMAWVGGFVETQLESVAWKIMTVATIAYEYRRLLDRYAELTDCPKDFVIWQGHDFSARGMSGVWDSTFSGMGHLSCFAGTDTVSAITAAEHFYHADITKMLVGASVPASEHSVMCMGGKENEVQTLGRLISEIYPSGIASIVSDTWDLWQLLDKVAPSMREAIEKRGIDPFGNAKVVFRPDSGDPVKIVCGDPYAPEGSPAHMGAAELLLKHFGHTVSPKGFRVCNPRVGLIYGDGMNLQTVHAILEGLYMKGISSSIIVFGIGSYSYQSITRDSLGFGYKATAGIIGNKFVEVFKDPVTDGGMKKSAKGLLRVELEDGVYRLYDQQTWEQEAQGQLQLTWKNGNFYRRWSLSDMRKSLGLHWPVGCV